MEIEITEEVQRIANACSKEPIRDWLDKLVFGKGEVLGADGFIIVRHPISYKGSQIGIKASEILTEPLGSLNRITLGDSPSNKVAYLHGKYTLKAETIEIVNLPNIEALYPQSETKAVFSITVSILKKMLSCFPDNTLVYMKLRDESDAIEFCSPEYEISGLMKPALGSRLHDARIWHRPTTNETQEKKSNVLP